MIFLDTNIWINLLALKSSDKEYENLPIEEGIVVNNISTIYAIYEALKYNKPMIERVVTFSGENLEDKRNVLVKIGTEAKEILEQLKIKNDSIIVAGGPMMGIKVDELVISANLNCVLALNNTNDIPSICLKCGKCVEVCPAKLSPVLIMKTRYKKEKDIKCRKTF